jgi:sugar/nucleoside kinase (ribokinase family)
VLAALGDVVDDIVVRLDVSGVRRGSDTPAHIARRRGGSAANVAEAAARLTGSARFLGRVGEDATAELVLRELVTAGVDVSHVQRSGRTGSIVVLVDVDGERSFLTDAGSARALDEPRPIWLDGVDVLHVPFYSLVDEPIATTAATVIGWASERGVWTSLDASSVSVLESFGVERARALIASLLPTFLFANADEARALGIDGPLGSAITVVKRGAAPTTVFVPGRASVEVPGERIEGVRDTTAAGDVFAAGFLTAPNARADPAEAARAGHVAAAALLRSRSA